MGIKFSSKRPLTQEEEAAIQKMIASDPDAPEATDEQLAKAKPFKEALPEMAAWGQAKPLEPQSPSPGHEIFNFGHGTGLLKLRAASSVDARR
ncbi:hypothetical protein DR92_2327 [Brucella anthropi]|nr:hypothetical protein DR92_2327 [Brucella anthropi]